MAAYGVRSALLYELFVHFDFASSSKKLLDLRHPLGSSNMDVSPQSFCCTWSPKPLFIKSPIVCNDNRYDVLFFFFATSLRFSEQLSLEGKMENITEH